jgi:hypothetical protein
MRVSHETIYLSLFVQHVTERFSAARSPGRFVGGIRSPLGDSG